MINIHVDAQVWQDNWEELSVGPSGGQASSKIVRHKDKLIDRAFLKILNRQNDEERRARLYREVASLETLDVDGVPRLRETNARHYEDKKFRLYLVTDFVEGSNLREAEPASPARSIDLAVQLCDILKACHDAGIVHRDIKPDNCIIAPNGKLHLVDFGLAFRIDEDGRFETPVGQEIGNRFLRLPEHHADSPNKIDPRTDLTSCVAMLFFMLTQLEPRVLVDEANRYPHQREAASKIIRDASPLRIDRLLALFDQAFQSSLDFRFQSVDALKSSLLSCLAEAGGSEESAEAIASRIRERTSNPVYLNSRSMMEKLHAIQQQIYVFSGDICGSLNGAFTIVGSSNESDARAAKVVYRLGFLYSQTLV
jgi:serine/threonine protein kinase